MPELMNYGKSKQGGNTLHEGHRYDTMIVSVWDKSLAQRKRRTTHQKMLREYHVRGYHQQN